jgi:hypothetical protein
MKNKFKVVSIALTALLVFSTMACFGQSGGSRSFNSANELKDYLDKQPVNGPDKPIRVAMKANDMMLVNIAKAIREAGKYVSLDLSGSPLTTIPEKAFTGCTPLAGIIIPNSVTSIEGFAFDGCNGLTSITIPNSVTSIGNGAFFRCESLTGITIPDSVTSIGNQAFVGCTSLTSVTIGNKVTSIGDGAFWECSFTSITIPNSVTNIEGGAFYGCTGLTSVTFQGTIPSSGFHYNAFSYIGDLRDKFYATDEKNGGTPGRYTRPNNSGTWTKQ